MTSARTSGTILAAALVAAAAACSSSSASSPSGSSADAGAESAAGGAGTTNISCLAILQCIADCDAASTTCPDACFAAGSADGQAKATTLANCIDAQKCTDGPCVEASCKPSLSDCVSSSTPAPTGSPLQGTAPPGDVPSELVGSYARANYGQTTRVVLNADGTGTYQIAISSLTAGCTSTSSTSQTGNAVVTTDTISIYATDVTTSQTQCSAAQQTTKGDPTRVDLRYTHPDANTLSIVDATCAAKYPDSPSSASLYCAETLTRE